MNGDRHELRLLEALLFAAAEPLDEDSLAERLPDGADVRALLTRLSEEYADRGVNLVRVAGKWALRTAEDLAPHLRQYIDVQRKLSRAAVETLAIIAYHQPVTRAEIEEMRGVATSRGTLDILMEAGWVRPKGRRRTPGRPETWRTTEAFLEHFGLDTLDDLPGVGELRAAGLLEAGRTSLSLIPEETAVSAEAASLGRESAGEDDDLPGPGVQGAGESESAGGVAPAEPSGPTAKGGEG